jgi:hypothetical protein
MKVRQLHSEAIDSRRSLVATDEQVPERIGYVRGLVLPAEAALTRSRLERG